MFKLKSKQKRRRNTSDDEDNDQIDDVNIKIAEQIELTEVVIPTTDSPNKKQNKKRTFFFDTYNGLIYRRRNNFLNESQLDSCDDTLERFESNYSNQPQGWFLF